jgi:predicted ABC-type ATPase
MAALSAVLAIVGTATLYDNASDQQHRIVAEVRAGVTLPKAPERPQWVDLVLDVLAKTERM